MQHDKTVRRLCCTAALFIASGIARAACADAIVDEPERWHVGITASSLGAGFELRRSLGQFAVRRAFNTLSMQHTKTLSDVRYAGKLQLQTGGLLFDWQPVDSDVRFTAGVLLNGTQLRVDAAPRSGDVQYRGQTYASSQIGTAKGTGEFNALSPYLGVGYAYAFGSDLRFRASLDIGVLYQGKLGVDVSVACGLGVPEPLCGRLTNEVQDQARNLERSAHFSTYYPVVSVGLTYRLGGG